MAEELSLDDEIKRLLEADPFLPFHMSLTSGEKFEVNNPDLFALGASFITLVHRRAGRVIFRKNQIVSIESQD